MLLGLLKHFHLVLCCWGLFSFMSFLEFTRNLSTVFSDASDIPCTNKIPAPGTLFSLLETQKL